MRARGAGLGVDAMTWLAGARAAPTVSRGQAGVSAACTRVDARAGTERVPRGNVRRGSRDALHLRRVFSARATSTSDTVDGHAFGTLGAPGPGEGSAHQIAALTSWLKAHGVDFSDRARFVRVRGMGVGGVATRALRQGDAIFSVPMFAKRETRVSNAPGSSETGDADDTAVPLVLTTAAVMHQSGPLGRLGRALAAAGVVVVHPNAEPSADLRVQAGSSESIRRTNTEYAYTPTHRLGGILETDHEFPLNVSSTSLLALALLFQCARAEAPKKKSKLFLKKRFAERNERDSAEDDSGRRRVRDRTSPHWAAYVDLLPRETDALLEWTDEDLRHLKGSKHAARARERRERVDRVHDEIFPALRSVDPDLFRTDDECEDAGNDLDARKARRESSRRESSRRESSREEDAFIGTFESKRAFRWAFATVLARAFELPAEVSGSFFLFGDKKELGLCPGLDLFNHADDAERCVVEGLPGDDDVDVDDDARDETSFSRDIDEGVSRDDSVRLFRNDSSFLEPDADDANFDSDEARLKTMGPRITLRVGPGGASPGEQLFHRYADRADGGSLLEFGFVRARATSETAAAGFFRAADVSLEPLLLRHGRRERARRLEALSRLGLCRGLTYEVTDAPEETRKGSCVSSYAYSVAAAPRAGAACVPNAMARMAKVLTLDDAELAAVSDWDDPDGGVYDGDVPFSRAHERRFASAMARLFRDELERLRRASNESFSAGDRSEPSRAPADSPAAFGRVGTPGRGLEDQRRTRRRDMARRVHEGETSLLEEIARDFETDANVS